MTHPLRPDRWSVLVVKDGYPVEVAEFEWAETDPAARKGPFTYEWDYGHPGYADPHEFDRHAVAAFYAAADEGLVHDWARLAQQGSFSMDGVSSSRAALIAEWNGRGDPVYPDSHGFYTEEMLRANKGSEKAAGYLHQRGFDLGILASLDGPLRALVTEIGLGDGRGAHRHDPNRPDDDLDRVLYVLAAGMSGPEIAAALTDGDWPGTDTLTLMVGLRTG